MLIRTGQPVNSPYGHLPNGNVVKANVSFFEIYGKATYTINDHGPSASRNGTRRQCCNTGADGWYTVGNITYTVPSTWFAERHWHVISGDLGYWALGTSDNFLLHDRSGCPGLLAAPSPTA